MQLFVLMLVMGLLVADEAGPVAWGPDDRGGWEIAGLIAAAIGPYLAPVLFAAASCGAAARTLRRRPERAARAVAGANLTISLARLVVVGVFFYSLFGLGWLAFLDRAMGEWVLVNELLALAPPLAAATATWWSYYPIERRLREQSMIRQIDAGEPIRAVPPRGAYVVEQVRHHLLLMLAPMLAILAWAQAVEALLPASMMRRASGTAVVFAGAAAVFALAPMMIRFIWRTDPMPDGALRRRLLELCRRHAVRVRELLVWRTHSGMVNGAVIGLVGPLRYILLTDGLIERLDDRQVEAVMAHELGHVRRRHMPWMAVCALGTLGAVFTLIDLAASALAGAGLIDPVGGSVLTVDPMGHGTAANLATAGALVVGIGAWAVAFGYVSRRFERQADTFAVQHLAAKRAEAEAHGGAGAGRDGPARAGGASGGGGAAVIDAGSVEAMAGALRSVASLNAAPAGRRSWRHGSIRWRVEYLQSLVGTPIDRCAIDGRVRMIQWGCAVLLAASALAQSRF